MEKEEEQCIFNGKQNFLEHATKQAGESALRPIYRRSSSTQKKALRRVSAFQWGNMSGRWENSISLVVTDDDDDDDDEKDFIGFCHQDSGTFL